MKQSRLLLLLSLVGTLGLCLFMAACGEESEAPPQTEHIHDYSEHVTPPTCTQQGFTTHSCSCGDSYTDSYTKARGHSMDPVAEKKPTCTQPGWTAYSMCSRCDFKEGYESLPALGHDMQPVEAREPTCTEVGWEAYRQCSRCRIIQNYREIPASGHDMRPVEAREPTCTEAGWEAYEECRNCPFSTFSYLPALYMRFELKDDGTYSVIGLSSDCTEGEIAIPETYMGKPVTAIRDLAFYNHRGLTTVSIPDSVTSIGNSAFMNCINLKSVTMGRGVTSIGLSAFAFCEGLMRVYIEDISAWCRIKFASSQANPMAYAKDLYLGENKVTALRIPSGITEILPYSFYQCSELKSVLFPETLTSVGSNAFYGCYGLTGELALPDGVTYIGSNAFFGCSRLNGVSLGKGILTIGDHAFEECDLLASAHLPEGLVSIGAYAFRHCKALTDVTIPSSVISVGQSAFHDSKIVEWEGNVGYVGQWAVGSMNSATAVTLREGTTCIADHAFLISKQLTEVTIPESVVLIGSYAFQGCPLERVTFEGGTGWSVLKGTLDNAKPIDVGDAVRNAELLTFDYVDYTWSRTV